MNHRKVVTDLLIEANRRRILPGEFKVVGNTSDWDLVTLSYSSDTMYIQSGEIRIYTEDDARASFTKFQNTVAEIATQVVFLKNSLAKDAVNKHSFKLNL
jgi:hypothetical protein